MGGYWSKTIHTNNTQFCCESYKVKTRIGYTSNPLQRGVWRVKTTRNCMKGD